MSQKTPWLAEFFPLAAVSGAVSRQKTRKQLSSIKTL